MGKNWRVPRFDVPSILEQAAAETLQEHERVLSTQTIHLLSAILDAVAGKKRYWEWNGNWLSPEQLQTLSDVLATAQHELLEEQEDEEVTENCVWYSAKEPLYSWWPASPWNRFATFSSWRLAWVSPAGLAAWLLQELFGANDTDAFVAPTAPSPPTAPEILEGYDPAVFDDYGPGFPSVSWTINNTTGAAGIMFVYGLKMVLGGWGWLVRDNDPLTLEVLDLSVDIPETLDVSGLQVEDEIAEVLVPPGEHSYTFYVFPSIIEEPPWILPGGGLRGIRLCGAMEVITMQEPCVCDLLQRILDAMSSCGSSGDSVTNTTTVINNYNYEQTVINDALGGNPEDVDPTTIHPDAPAHGATYGGPGGADAGALCLATQQLVYAALQSGVGMFAVGAAAAVRTLDNTLARGLLLPLWLDITLLREDAIAVNDILNRLEENWFDAIQAVICEVYAALTTTNVSSLSAFQAAVSPELELTGAGVARYFVHEYMQSAIGYAEFLMVLGKLEAKTTLLTDDDCLCHESVACESYNETFDSLTTGAWYETDSPLAVMPIGFSVAAWGDPLVARVVAEDHHNIALRLNFDEACDVSHMYAEVIARGWGDGPWDGRGDIYVEIDVGAGWETVAHVENGLWPLTNHILNIGRNGVLSIRFTISSEHNQARLSHLQVYPIT